MKKMSGWKLLLLGITVVVIGGQLVSTARKLREAKARANLIGCRSSLRALGLGCRLWATDRGGRYPDSWQDLTNFVASPRLMICPLDTTKGDLRNVPVAQAIAAPTYFYEAKSAMEGEPGRVVTFCPYHGVVLLTEGEVIELGHPLTEANFEVRDGKKYLSAALVRGFRF